MAEARVLPLSEEEPLRLRPQRGLWSDAFSRLSRNRLALGALVVLVFVALLAYSAPYVPAIERHDPAAQDYSAIHANPSTDHFFGTDNLGRDTWARSLEGLRISLQVGLGVAALILIIGMLVGGIAALGGSWLDNAMMRLTDLAYAFPDLLFIILLRSVLIGRDWPHWMSYDIIFVPGPSLTLESIVTDPVLQMVAAISFVAWVTLARLVRGQMLSLRERDFVIAARAMGASSPRIVWHHMIPNTLGPVIVAVVFAIPLAIFSESILSFIGIGVPAPKASLGVLVSTGYDYISVNEWLAIFPAACIGVLMLCFTFLGDGLRDALDPRGR